MQSRAEVFAEIKGPLWDMEAQCERQHVHTSGWHAYGDSVDANAMVDKIVRSTGLHWATDGRVTVTLVMDSGRRVKTTWPSRAGTAGEQSKGGCL